jgi:hypothetical protein
VSGSVSVEASCQKERGQVGVGRPSQYDVKGGVLDSSDSSAAARERQQCHNANANGAVRAATLLTAVRETPTHELRAM